MSHARARRNRVDCEILLWNSVITPILTSSVWGMNWSKAKTKSVYAKKRREEVFVFVVKESMI